jgi:hypothetical protein
MAPGTNRRRASDGRTGFESLRPAHRIGIRQGVTATANPDRLKQVDFVMFIRAGIAASTSPDQLIFMDQGMIVEQGDPRAMIAEPQSPRTREFLSRVL